MPVPPFLKASRILRSMVTGIDGRPILGYARDRPCLSRLAHSLRKVELADQIAEDDRAVAGRPLTSRLQAYLISHVVLCGMSIANEPAGSPAGVGLVIHLNGSRPVMPAYLPVPPVII